MPTPIPPHDRPVRAAADLAATVVAQTDQINCWGCGLVAVELLATNAELLAAAEFQVSNDSMQVAAASSTWQTVRANIGVLANTTDIGTAMNAGGIRCLLFSVGAANAASRGIPWRKCRLQMTGHATNAITGLAANANVYP